MLAAWRRRKLAIRGWLWLLLKGMAEGLRRGRLLGHGRMLGSRDLARHKNKNQKKITPELKDKISPVFDFMKRLIITRGRGVGYL